MLALRIYIQREKERERGEKIRTTSRKIDMKHREREERYTRTSHLLDGGLYVTQNKEIVSFFNPPLTAHRRPLSSLISDKQTKYRKSEMESWGFRPPTESDKIHKYIRIYIYTCICEISFLR